MNWGFAGYGRIAQKFEEGLRHTDHKLVAIASRSGANQISVPIKAYSNYDDLCRDPEVDIVYVNTTHNTHAAITINALNSGKHVLCEKPMSTSETDVGQMIEAAKNNNRFLMEAIWTRYLPGYQHAIEIIKSGTIGDVLQVNAHFGFKMNPEDPKERLINPNLAAGAIWDVGIYPISLAQDIYDDDPLSIHVDADLSSMNIENRCAIQMSYKDKRIAQLSCAINLSTINTACITGTKGSVVMKDFWKCEQFTVITKKGSKEHHFPMTSNGLCHEAIACADLINNRMTESPLIRWSHSLQLARIMDMAIKYARN